MALNPSTGWQWYKKLNISNSSADYQIKLRLYKGEGTDDPENGKIYCDKHCKNFPNDIRFGTTNNPSTAIQLPQWIEYYQEGGLQDISYDSTILGWAGQGVAMDDEYFYCINSKRILVVKISDGKFLKAAFQYDASTDTYTDYTDEINNWTTSDVELLPATPAEGDAFYFGLYNKFTGIQIRIEEGDQGSDITITWKYWNGTSWTPLPNVVDETNSFTTYGWIGVRWDRPTDWQQNTVNGVTAYWIKAEVTSVGASPTQPKATAAASGKHTENDGDYTDHLSDGHVLSYGGSNYLYVAGSNYPNTPGTGAVYKYKTAKDPNSPLDYVGVVKDFSSESCPGWLSGVDRYEVNGTTYWWVSWDVDDASSSNPSQIWRYDYDSSDDTNWTNKTVYNLGYYHTGYNIQGFTWWEDDYGGKYIICPIHEGSSPAKVDVYKWNGNGFDNYAQYDYVENPQGEVSSQGVCRDFSGDNTYLYFASRLGPVGNPILKGEMVQTEEYVDIWIKLPSSAPSSIYLFVGNSNANKYSDGDATFIFFDDYEDTSLDTSKWVNVGSNSISISNSEITLTSQEGSTTEDTGIRSINTFSTSTTEMYVRIKRYGDSGADNDIIIGISENTNFDADNWRTSTAPNIWAWLGDTYGSQTAKIRYYDGATVSTVTSPELDPISTSYKLVRIRFKSGDLYFAMDNAASSGTLSHTISSYYVTLSINSADNYGFTADYIFVKKYTSPEPSWSSFGDWECIEKVRKKKIGWPQGLRPARVNKVGRIM